MERVESSSKPQPLTEDQITEAARTLTEISAGQQPSKKDESFVGDEKGVHYRLTRRATIEGHQVRSSLVLSVSGKEQDIENVADKFTAVLGEPSTKRRDSGIEVISWSEDKIEQPQIPIPTPHDSGYFLEQLKKEQSPAA